MIWYVVNSNLVLRVEKEEIFGLFRIVARLKVVNMENKKLFAEIKLRKGKALLRCTLK